MGLLKKIKTPSGVTAEYHRITTIKFLAAPYNCAEITVASYPDQEIRDEGAQPLGNPQPQRTPAGSCDISSMKKFAFFKKNPLEWGYDYLKNNIEQWKDAENV